MCNVPQLGDSDFDGLTEADEFREGTDPNLFDTDADGIADGIEIRLGFDPLSAADPIQPVPDPDNPVIVAWLDSDNDGLTDTEEIAAGTDPFDRDTNDNGWPDAAEPVVATLARCLGHVQAHAPLHDREAVPLADGAAPNDRGRLVAGVDVDHPP